MRVPPQTAFLLSCEQDPDRHETKESLILSLPGNFESPSPKDCVPLQSGNPDSNAKQKNRVPSLPHEID